MPEKKKKAASTSKIKNWEIKFPVPLVLDSTISDESLIAELAAVETETEINNVFNNAIELAKDGHVVTCSKPRLFKLIEAALEEAVNEPGLLIEIQEWEDMFLILVKDEKENVIGRGQITEVGQKVDPEVFKKKFTQNLVDFKKRFDFGQQRMTNLTYKLKTLRNGMFNNMASKGTPEIVN